MQQVGEHHRGRSVGHSARGCITGIDPDVFEAVQGAHDNCDAVCVAHDPAVRLDRQKQLQEQQQHQATGQAGGHPVLFDTLEHRGESKQIFTLSSRTILHLPDQGQRQGPFWRPDSVSRIELLGLLPTLVQYAGAPQFQGWRQQAVVGCPGLREYRDLADAGISWKGMGALLDVLQQHRV